MAALHRFVTVAKEMAPRDREVRCWPHEFSVLQSAVDAMGSTVTTPFCALAACVFLSLTAPVSVHCAAFGAPTQITLMKAKLAATTTPCFLGYCPTIFAVSCAQGTFGQGAPQDPTPPGLKQNTGWDPPPSP